MKKQRLEIDGLGGSTIYLDSQYIKGYETNNEGLPTCIFFGTGVSWPVEPTKNNLKVLESINL